MNLTMLEKAQHDGMVSNDWKTFYHAKWYETNAGFDICFQGDETYSRSNGRIEKIQGNVTTEQLAKYGVELC